MLPVICIAAMSNACGDEEPTAVLESSILVQPTRLDFGGAHLDCGVLSLPVQLQNVSRDAIVVASAAIEDPAFSVRPEAALPATVPAGGGMRLEVNYRPDAGPRLDTLEVRLRVRGNERTISIAVEGVGSADRQAVDTFQQLPTPQVDVLLVVDDTLSMREEGPSLARNLAALGRLLERSELDYHVGLIDTGGLGQLRATTSSEYYLSPRTSTRPEEGLPALAASLVPRDGSNLATRSASVAVASSVLDRANLGFYRPAAALNLIFVSDGPDDSTYDQDELLNDLYRVKGFRNSPLLAISAVTAPTPEGSCTSSTADATTDGRLRELADRAGGSWDSICSPTWSSALQPSARPSVHRSFQLSDRPIPSTLEVEVAGTVVPRREASGQPTWNYQASDNTIRFSSYAIPEYGAAIRARYVRQCP